MTKGLFSAIEKVVIRCKGGVLWWVSAVMGGGGSVTGVLLLSLMKKTGVAALTCSIALGGATVGVISGAIKGQTTEIGFLRGAVIGTIAGAITALQLFESVILGEPFSKVALLISLMNGKVFMEWVTPAVLKAYQWQISGVEESFSESSDIFETNEIEGLAQDSIKRLPKCKFSLTKTNGERHGINCIVCLEDFRSGELTRMLPSCEHRFHLQCIDEWLTRHSSCPVCRKHV
ncbi:RING-type E3 ubiquitin transferase [Sarracenia purpurea var. burkii]